MTSLSVIEYRGALVVDSRLIAQELGIEHRAFMQTLKRYQDKIESTFGVVAFEMSKPLEGSLGGRPEKYALLTEPQASILMTFSRNTEQVVECKLSLVVAFEKAKQVIKTIIPAQSERIKELELTLAIEKERNQQRQLDHTMLTLHGAELVLTLRGKEDQIVRVETVVTEVVEPKTQATHKIITAEQLKKEISKRTGQKLASAKWFTDKLRKIGRDDLLTPVTRHVTGEYIAPDNLDEAIKLVYGNDKQLVIGE